MKITLKKCQDGVTRVFSNGVFSGIIKVKDNHFLCYSKGHHTTTQNLTEVIRFFNGDFDSYYYRGNER